jgi:hypothetical protein
MFAMSLLLTVFEPATTAASMAIGRPETIDDAPASGPERSGGWRRRDFLASRGMGESPGEESRSDAVAAQAIEAQPVSGQIRPSRGKVRRGAEEHRGEDLAKTGFTRTRGRRLGQENDTQGAQERWFRCRKRSG